MDLDGSAVKNFYIELSGAPRFELFSKISKILNCKNIDKAFILFNNLFTQLNKTELKKTSLFYDAKDFITTSYRSDIRMFISSSAPEDELLNTTKSALESPYDSFFERIMGTTKDYQKGELHIQKICGITGCSKEDLLFFGDDYEDYRLAFNAGISCIIIDREKRHTNQDIPTVHSFNNI
jgi:phosphoglycolate phosphatase-like HAD superfamily hydrolase